MSLLARNLYQALSSVAICPFSVSSSIDLVADEVDAGNAGGGPFGDREDQVDAVLRPLDDLRIDAGGEFAVAAIELDDALDVGLHLGAGEDAARLDLHFLGEVLVGNLVVALEHHLIDDGIFDHPDRQRAVVEIDLHVGEQAGGEQRLQRLIDIGGIVGSPSRIFI